MIFNILILGVLIGVAYFHYAQGLFSAFISTVLAVVAAAVALGFHEQVFSAIGQGKMADVSLGAILVALYAVTYLILRVAMDSMVPGNVDFGSIGNQVGAGLFGVLAGLITAGVIAIAAQSMPFGISILGFSRWECEDRQVSLGEIPGWARVGRADITDFLVNHNEMKVGEFKDGAETAPLNPAKMNNLWLSPDEFVSTMVGRLSAGSLSGGKPWFSSHPDYPAELFGYRIGIQSGAKKTAFPINKVPQVDGVAVFKGKEDFNLIDGDLPNFRDKGDKLPDTLKPGEGHVLIVVRMAFRHDASEKDDFVRFSPGSIRLCAGGKNYYPIGFLKDDETVAYQHPDDFLLVPSEKGVDAVFSVEPEGIFGKDASAAAATKVGPDVFLEFKRMTDVQLDGKELKTADDLSDDEGKFWKSILRREGWEEKVAGGDSGGKKGKKK